MSLLQPSTELGPATFALADSALGVDAKPTAPWLRLAHDLDFSLS